MKRFIPSIILVVIGALCVAAYWIIGSHVMPDGRVVEPFFLTASGEILIFLGILSAIIVGVIALVKALTHRKKPS